MICALHVSSKSLVVCATAGRTHGQRTTITVFSASLEKWCLESVSAEQLPPTTDKSIESAHVESLVHVLRTLSTLARPHISPSPRVCRGPSPEPNRLSKLIIFGSVECDFKELDKKLRCVTFTSEPRRVCGAQTACRLAKNSLAAEHAR